MKKYFFLISLFVVVVSLFFILPLLKKNGNNHLPAQEKPLSKIVVFQKITTGSLSTDFIKYTINQTTTAWQLLKQTNQIKTQGEESMVFVIEINGVAANQKNREYWAFYINEKLAAVGAGSYQLKNNDKIEWKIEKY